MKRYLFPAAIRKFIVLLFCVSALAGTANSLYAFSDYTKKFQKSLDLASGGEVSIEAYKGSIKISTWDKEKVEIVAMIKAPLDVSPEYARKSVAATNIDVDASGNSIFIRSNYDRMPSRDSRWGHQNTSLPFVHYDIKTPRALELRVEDYKSDIEVADMDGRIDIETYKGSLEAKNLAGRLFLETYKGDFFLSAIDGSIDASTYKGEIEFEHVKLTDVSRFETGKGLIALQLPKSFAFELHADLGERGDLRSDFQLPNRYEHRSRERIRTSINGGGPSVYLKTHKGEFRLRH